MTDRQKAAFILRGPPTTGKTQIGTEIVRQAISRGYTSHLVVLDEGWAPAEFRFCGNRRYHDLDCDCDVLAVELGQGEPPHGFAFKGATTAPREWIAILEKAGRQIRSYRLTIPEHLIPKRLKTRMEQQSGHPVSDFLDEFALRVTALTSEHRAYANLDMFTRFAALAQIQEQQEPTESGDWPGIAAAILKRAGIQ